MSKTIKKPSLLNWMGTLFLMTIPGVNLLAMILFIIFAKTQAKRSFAIAGLLLTLLYAVLLVIGATMGFQGMALSVELRTVATLPVTGAIGFLMVHHIASWLDRHDGVVKRFMVYCGNNTLYIYIFHIISFKLVSALKIWYYGLDWGQIGCHMVIHENSTTDLFWVLYTIVGTAVPLIGITLYRHVKDQVLSHKGNN